VHPKADAGGRPAPEERGGIGLKLGFSEIIVILIVAMIVIGPDKLPYYARNAGKALQGFRKALNETKEEVRDTLDETMGDVIEPMKDLKQEADNLRSEMKDSVKSTFDPFQEVKEEAAAADAEKE
jgi:sec-independent protein translocase protein TatB